MGRDDGLEGMRVLGERFRCGEFVLLEREGLVDFVLALLELVEAGEGRLADLVLGLGVGGVGFVGGVFVVESELAVPGVVGDPVGRLLEGVLLFLKVFFGKNR